MDGCGDQEEEGRRDFWRSEKKTSRVMVRALAALMEEGYPQLRAFFQAVMVMNGGGSIFSRFLIVSIASSLEGRSSISESPWKEVPP